MSTENSQSQTETFVAPPSLTERLSFQTVWQRLVTRHIAHQLPICSNLAKAGHILIGMIALTAGIATAQSLVSVRFMERQVQTMFFNLRPAVKPPENLVILAVERSTLEQARITPQSNPDLQSLVWPFKRATYAKVIDRLLQAGARAVAVDVIWADPSFHGAEDDAKLQQVLKRYPGRVVMAATYDNSQTRQGDITQLTLPTSSLRNLPQPIGTINFWTEPDNFWKEPEGSEGRIHRLGSEFVRLKAQVLPDQATYLNQLSQEYPSFAEATLKAAKVEYSPPKGDMIFYYGPSVGDDYGSIGFTTIPFWHVLDAANWTGYLENGQFFKGKIVVIGTAENNNLKDFLPTPMGKMPGVEVHANAIATLMQNRSLVTGIPAPLFQGLFVAALILAVAYLQSRTSRPIHRFGWGMVIMVALGIVSYGLFTRMQLVLPTAVPLVAIALGSTSYLLVGITDEKLRLIRAARLHRASEDVREFLEDSGQEDLEQISESYTREIIGQTLRGRYKILKVLGTGGFSVTYIAEDLDLPGHPRCVVKQLRPSNSKPAALKWAQEKFRKEAETLYHLPPHDRIPRLLAYFEEKGEFYLIQDYVEGEPLRIRSFIDRLCERRVIEILEEILQILQFIHSHGIIHRDIKPPNIIQRQSDGHLVLIDFGVVKNIQQMGDREEATSMTMAVGTRGYISPEQSNGQPRPNSDIYSLGMMAIQAVTGIPSEDLVQQRDPHTGELIWHKHAFVSQALIQILDRMVRFNFTERYQSAAEVLADLQPLIELYRSDPADPDFPAAESREVDEEDDSASEPTQLWQDASDLDVALPETDPSPEDSEPLDSTQKTEDGSTEATQPWISEEHSATDLPPTSPADPPSAAQD